MLPSPLLEVIGRSRIGSSLRSNFAVMVGTVAAFLVYAAIFGCGLALVIPSWLMRAEREFCVVPIARAISGIFCQRLS
jgi:hypothetical protein